MDSGLKRKDTTKGPPLRILSLGKQRAPCTAHPILNRDTPLSRFQLPSPPTTVTRCIHQTRALTTRYKDGGGVRGYSMFIIIQEIMHRTFVEIEGRAPRRHEIPKPADHFDLIVGTGTGGLIALMLGRLRLDLETCKQLYVRLTRMVFETDKTILGIPTHATLFKASRLEEAIKDAVSEHTTSESEGDDGTSVHSPLSSHSRASAHYPRRHASNASVVSFSNKSPQAQMARPYYSGRGGGDPNARLYDEREYRTKTYVSSVFFFAGKIP